MYISIALRIGIFVFLTNVCIDTSFGQVASEITDCNFTDIDNPMIEVKIINGVNEPITLRIPEDYFVLRDSHKHGKVFKELRLRFIPKSLLPPSSKHPSRVGSFASRREARMKLGDIQIYGHVAGNQKTGPHMNWAMQQIIQDPDRQTELKPKTNGLLLLKGYSNPSFMDFYLEIENDTIITTITCEQGGYGSCFAFLPTKKYAELSYSFPSQQLVRWNEFKNEAEKLLNCFEEE